jgi:hypothetical protein
MVCDEAPAATRGGVNESGDRFGTGLEAGFFRVSDPNSFVAAEIHLGFRPAGINDDWPRCNIQVACHTWFPKILC